MNIDDALESYTEMHKEYRFIGSLLPTFELKLIEIIPAASPALVAEADATLRGYKYALDRKDKLLKELNSLASQLKLDIMKYYDGHGVDDDVVAPAVEQFSGTAADINDAAFLPSLGGSSSNSDAVVDAGNINEVKRCFDACKLQCDGALVLQPVIMDKVKAEIAELNNTTDIQSDHALIMGFIQTRAFLSRLASQSRY